MEEALVVGLAAGTGVEAREEALVAARVVAVKGEVRVVALEAGCWEVETAEGTGGRAEARAVAARAAARGGAAAPPLHSQRARR